VVLIKENPFYWKKKKGFDCRKNLFMLFHCLEKLSESLPFAHDLSQKLF